MHPAQDGLDRRRRKLVFVPVGLLRGLPHLRGAELGTAAAAGAPLSVRLAGGYARAFGGAGEKQGPLAPQRHQWL